MKKGLLVMLVVVASVAGAFAQGPPPPPTVVSAPLDTLALVFLAACAGFAVYSIVARRRKQKANVAS